MNKTISNNKTAVSRADLLRLLAEYGEEGLRHGAEAAGFVVIKNEDIQGTLLLPPKERGLSTKGCNHRQINQ